MWLLSGRGASRLCMLVILFTGAAGAGDLLAAGVSSPGPSQPDAAESLREAEVIRFGGVDESVADAFRPRIDDLAGPSFTESLDNPQFNTLPTAIGRAVEPPAAIPLPAPVFLGLTGFAFMVSVKFVKRFFF